MRRQYPILGTWILRHVPSAVSEQELDARTLPLQTEFTFGADGTVQVYKVYVSAPSTLDGQYPYTFDSRRLMIMVSGANNRTIDVEWADDGSAMYWDTDPTVPGRVTITRKNGGLTGTQR